MLDILFRMSDIKLFTLLSCSFILFSIISVTALHRLVPHEVRQKENAVIGTVSCIISLIYGVLAGLIAFNMIDTTNTTSNAVQREANAAANIYRDSNWLNTPIRAIIQTNIKQYLNHVINDEWPLMADGKIPNHVGNAIIDNISDQLINYHVNKPVEPAVISDLLNENKELYNAREFRIHASTIDLGPEIWLVIFIGSILTIGINFLFGMNYYLHLLSTTATALMVSSMLFLLITSYKPFQGEFVVQPDSLQLVLQYIESHEGSPIIKPSQATPPIK
ncbi:MAG: hypothetical protein SFW66_10740 [Gammaproteobacteria bacterium]|nr:hypothetical protein [Gammaproteobacteria bacterium]